MVRVIHEVGFHHSVVQRLGPAVIVAENLVLLIQ